MEQDAIVRAVLLADELERVIERLDRRLQRALHTAAAQPHLVDVPLDFLEADLALLQEQVGAALGFLDDQPGLVLRRVLDLVGQALRGQERVAQVGFPLAVLGAAIPGG